jgi:hypothetical protein
VCHIIFKYKKFFQKLLTSKVFGDTISLSNERSITQMNNYYIDFSSSIKISALNEDDAKEKFFTMLSELPINLEYTEIDTVEEQ